jgi:hypothetical protein
VTGPVTMRLNRSAPVPGPTTRRWSRSAVTGLLPLVGRGREVLMVGFGSLALSAAMTWPVLRSPKTTVAQDLVDPLYFVWQIAWTGHALGTDPASMYTTNAFLGAPGNLAYTDTVLGYAPFATLVNALVPGTPGALLTYNLLYVLAAALAFAGAYLLARVVGARIPAALVAGAAYAYAPWHLAHARHLNVLSTGGIALAFALLAFGHGWTLREGRGRPVRPGWIVAGWLVACWQLSLGFAIGVPFAWALFLIMLTATITWWRRGKPPVAPGLRKANAIGVAAFGVSGVLLALPFLRVVGDFPVAKRTEEMVQRYSPPVRGLITAPPESWWWGSLHSGLRDGMNAIPEQAIFPGLVLFLLAVAGLGYSAWAVRHRVVLAVVVFALGLLALGTSAPGGGHWTYLAVFKYLPGWEVLRTPGRLILWCTLAMALLAAGTVTKLTEQVVDRVRRPYLVLLLVPALLVLLEGAGRVDQPVVPTTSVALRSLPGPVLVLPTSQQGDYVPMTWSTDGWPLLVNGGSGFESPIQSKLRRTAQAFPAADAVQELRSEGVRTVVLDRNLAVGTWWAALANEPDGPFGARAADSGVRVRVEGNAVIYDLTGGP